MKTEGVKEAVIARLNDFIKSVEQRGLCSLDDIIKDAKSLERLRDLRDDALPEDLLAYIIYDVAHDVQPDDAPERED